MSAYTDAGRVTVAATAEALRTVMIDHWWAHLPAEVEPAEALLVAATPPLT